MPFYFGCAIVAPASFASLLSLCLCLCPCYPVFFVLVALAGVITFVVLASPLLLCWRLCPYCKGIFALVALPSLRTFCTGINHRHCSDVFTVVLLTLSSKAHIALVSLPFYHWCRCHRCVVHTNIGARVIVCIGMRTPLHLFTAIHNLIFNRSHDCYLTLKLSWACFHNDCSHCTIASLAAGNSSLIVIILWVIVPGVLVRHCLCGPHSVGLHSVKPKEECPLLALPLGYLSLRLLS